MANWDPPHVCPVCRFGRGSAPCKVCFPREWEEARLRRLAVEDQAAGPGRMSGEDALRALRWTRFDPYVLPWRPGW